MVLKGQIRVQRISAGGHEIVLYRIGPGESCILITACLFSYRPVHRWSSSLL
ncbi:Crp/Fnr family transcriptional regulator [Acidithiobacillus thiooxidans ATCC 19377]|uniref:Crp/Fnr family transcriptional regulator n=1 Tax=Acidithiobacillus thiooxidans ATCC 19377 TaxID=637390 RepID=A0A5P9XLG9_ACITH|nr:Crp/Fnr family transcriptional regulator [Acidithiobacillus thiooxidans ATCC 19377]